MAPLVLGLLLSGCAAGPSGSIGADAGPGAPPAAAGEGRAAGSEQGRSIVITGRMQLIAEAPATALTAALAVVAEVGGRIDRREQAADEQGGVAWAELVLRVPNPALDRVLARLGELGVVEELALGEQDVTATVSDLDARIAARRAALERLRGMLAGTRDTDELIMLEDAISDRQGALDALVAERDRLGDDTAFATLVLSISSPRRIAAPSVTDLPSAIAAGWSAMLAIGSGLLIVLGFLLPWLVLAAAVLLIVRWLLRRRRRAAAAEAAAAPPPPPVLPGA